MNKFVGLMVVFLLSVMAVSLVQIAFGNSKKPLSIFNQGAKEFSIKNLKKAEQKHREYVYSPDRNGRVRERKAEGFERQYLNLANRDVSEFFKQDIPLDKPHMTPAYINTWVALVLSDVMTFGFNDYKMRLSLASNYFTDMGWKSFTQALKRSRIIEMVEVNQQLITAAPKGAPVLQSEGLVNGRYQWVIEMPLILTYRSGSKTSRTGLLVTAIVKRSDDEKHPYGIAIDQWIAIAR